MKGKQKKKLNGETKKIIFLGALIVLLVIAGLLLQKEDAGRDKSNLTQVDLFVMSQCPYGVKAENLVNEVRNDFDSYVNFNVEYIADVDGDGFQSLHGQPEVEGNLYQLCVKENYPDKFWDFVICQNEDYSNITDTFESCANEAGVDYEKIKTCATSEEGKNLLTDSLNKANELGVTGSPTFFIDGEQYTGPRGNAVDISRALCRAIEDEAPACAELPEAKKFTTYIINDSRCEDLQCNTSQIEGRLLEVFPGMQVERLDYSTEEGKSFYNEKALTLLPAILFDEGVKEATNYSDVESYLRETDGLYELRIGSSFDPKKEICDNDIDDTGNGKIDCSDPDCDGDFSCREEISGRLDLFVMSMCPYGTLALDAMEEVLDNFGETIDFHVNYIANENEDGTFTALHGQPEVDENIRELCAMEYYPESYMEYIWCRNDDMNTDWQECAVDFPKVKTCFESNEGQGLHSENIKFANNLGIGASPTWMVNNQYLFSGIDAETIRQNFCQYNDVEGCENVLGATTDTPAGACN